MTQDRIGLVAFWKNYDRETYLKAAQLADELGYDSFWLPEAWGYDAIPLITEMALKTKRIKIGTAIINVFSRSPGLIAMTAATLDEISEGRFVLGIGPSGKRVIEGFHGREFDKPLTQVRDVIRVVKTLLAGGRLSDAGAKLNEYRPFALEVPKRERHVPIYSAALKKQAITSIGELADGWIPTFWPFDKMDEPHRWIAEGAAKAGRDPSEIDTAPFTTAIPLGDEMGAKRAKEIVAFYIGGMGDYYKEMLTNFGFGEACERIDSLYKEKTTRKEAAAAVPDEMVERLMITGDPQKCVEKLKGLRDYGVTLPILNLPNEPNWAVQEMFIRAMAPR
jgi:F420-dependent oxidoreductase-like protein